MELDKYKIAPVKAAKGLEGDHDKKEERSKQDAKTYPAKDVDNEKVFEIRTKRIIDMLDDNDPRKQQYKKMLDEHKEMLKRDKNKKLNEKDATPVNKVDEIVENHPSTQDPETKIKEDGPNVGTGKQIKAFNILEEAEFTTLADKIGEAATTAMAAEIDKYEEENKKSFDWESGEELANLWKKAIEKIKAFFNIEGELQGASSGDISTVVTALVDEFTESLTEHLNNLEEGPGDMDTIDDISRKIVERVIVKLKKDFSIKGAQKADANKKLDELFKSLSDAMPQGHAKIDELINELQAEIYQAAENMLLTADDDEKEEKKEKKEDKAPATMDVFDVSEGLPLGDGAMAHKDEKTGEIYVIDKNGNELVRTVNAFVNDMGLVIEFYRDLLGLSEEEKEDKVESAALPIVEDEEKEEEEEVSEELPPSEEETEEQPPVEETPPALDAEPSSEGQTDDLSKKLDELLKVQKEQGEKINEITKESEEENLPDRSNEEMLNLQYEIEEKKNKVKSAIQYMIDNDKIRVSPEEISACKIKGESIIFAKQRAQEAKVQELVSRLYKASNEMIDMYIEAQKANDNNEADSIFQQLFR